jgi:two-component system sensor histidine kinase RegB
LSHAGEPFFTTKEPGHGMGLGLFLARSLLEQLGGGLELSSLMPAGTRVLLILPKPGTSSPAKVPVPADPLPTGA